MNTLKTPAPKLSFLLALIFLSSCSVQKYKATNKVYTRQVRNFAKIIEQVPPITTGQTDSLALSRDWAGTTNFSMRKPNYVIIHHTAQDTINQTIRTFTLPSTQVSAHYVIANDGTIYHMLNDYLRAHHAGVSKWGSVIDMNSCSIGIELDNNGSEPFSGAQINSLIKLLGNLKTTYNIPTANFVGHADIAPKRKPDPHEGFPWKKLAENGFGYWYADSVGTAPQGFDPVIALRIIGYDIADMNSAIIAFKRHFIGTDISPVLTQRDLDVMNNLYRRYL